jgi:ankyrin repeat protein/predicted acylesterase/phospholipase RssA
MNIVFFKCLEKSLPMIEEFISAIYTKNIVSLKRILDNDKSVLNQEIQVNSLGWHVLHLAANLGFDRIIEILIDHGVDLNLTDKYGWSAAHIAVLNGNYGSLKILISAGVNVNVLSNMHESLVFIAVKFNNPKILRYLIGKNANTMIKTSYQMKPSHMAASKGYLQCLKIILASKTYKLELNKEELAELFNEALCNNHIYVAEYLSIKYSALPNFSQAGKNWQHPDILLYMKLHELPFIDTIDNLEISKKLSECINQNKNIALLLATFRFLLLRKNNKHFSKYFIQAINKLTHSVNRQQLIKTLVDGAPTIALNLIKQIAIDVLNVDEQGTPLTCLIVENDDLDFLKAMLSHYDSKLILENYDYDHNSILHLSAQHGSIKIMQYLIKTGSISLLVRNKYGESPLHQAVMYNQDAIVRLLLIQCHVDPYIVDNELNTPLHAAAIQDFSLCTTLLKSVGAHLTLINKAGKTPLEIANEHANDKLSNILNDTNEKCISQYLPEFPGLKITTAVFQGGGVKGIGFCGALQKLSKEHILNLSELRIVAGTSAGAITALLLAIGYDINELGNIINDLNFYDLLESNLRSEFFEIKKKISERNGFESFLGKNVFGLINKIKSGTIDSDYIKSLLTSFMSSKMPTDFIHNVTKKLGIHDGEFNKLQEEINVLKARSLPFINHFKLNRGIFSGEILRRKFLEWITRKQLDRNLTFQMLHELSLSNNKYKDLYVAVYNVNKRYTEILSYETTPDVIVADAVRCSMSIQIFFEPHNLYVNKNGIRLKLDKDYSYFDGGSLNNYILGMFDKMRYVYLDQDLEWLSKHGDNKITNFNAIGFRLLEPKLYSYYEEENGTLPDYPDDGVMNFLMSIVSSVLSFTKQENDYLLNPDEHKRTVHINTLDIDTVEFDISDERKKKLIKSGENASNRFISKSIKYFIAKDEYLRKYFSHTSSEINQGKNLASFFKTAGVHKNSVSEQDIAPLLDVEPISYS